MQVELPDSVALAVAAVCMDYGVHVCRCGDGWHVLDDDGATLWRMDATADPLADVLALRRVLVDTSRAVAGLLSDAPSG